MKRVKAKIPSKRGRGGPQPGSGCPPSLVNMTAKQLREWAIKSGEMPHIFLLRIMRGEKIDDYQPTVEQRIEAAKACAPFLVPRLSNIAVTDEEGKPLQTQNFVLTADVLSRLTDSELEAFQYIFAKLSGKSVEGKLAPTMDKPQKPYTRTVGPGSESVH